MVTVYDLLGPEVVEHVIIFLGMRRVCMWTEIFFLLLPEIVAR